MARKTMAQLNDEIADALDKLEDVSRERNTLENELTEVKATLKTERSAKEQARGEAKYQEGRASALKEVKHDLLEILEQQR